MENILEIIIKIKVCVCSLAQGCLAVCICISSVQGMLTILDFKPHNAYSF